MKTETSAPEYFVHVEQVFGEIESYGPYSASEAKESFDRIQPDFDGGSVFVTKGSEAETTVAWQRWSISHDYGGDIVYRNQGKHYEPSFLAELQQARTNSDEVVQYEKHLRKYVSEKYPQPTDRQAASLEKQIQRAVKDHHKQESKERKSPAINHESMQQQGDMERGIER